MGAVQRVSRAVTGRPTRSADTGYATRRPAGSLNTGARAPCTSVRCHGGNAGLWQCCPLRSQIPITPDSSSDCKSRRLTRLARLSSCEISARRTAVLAPAAGAGYRAESVRRRPPPPAPGDRAAPPRPRVGASADLPAARRDPA